MALLLITSFFYLQKNEESQVKSLQENFSAQLDIQEKVLQQEVQRLSEKENNTPFNYFSKLHEDEGISLYVFTDSILTFWSDNEEPNNNLLVLKDGFFKSSGGYYKKHSLQKGKQTFVGTLCIKREHRFENSFVKNAFQSKFSLPSDCNLKMQNDTIQLVVNNNENNTNSSLALAEFLALLLLLFVGYQWCKKLHSNDIIKVLLFFLLSIVLRYFLMEFHFPFFLYEEKLMSPELFAYSEWLPSLGDLLLHSIFILFLVQFLVSIEITITKLKNVWIFLLLFGIIIDSLLLSEGIEMLVFNSNVELDIKKIFDLNFYSIISLTIVFILLYSFLLLVNKIVNIIRDSEIKLKSFLGLVGINILLGIPFYLFFDEQEDLLNLILMFPVIIILFYRSFKRLHVFELSSSILLILFVSLYISAALENNLALKEKDYREQKISLMSANHDPIAEYLFQGTVKNIKADSILHYLNDTVSTIKYLRTHFFNKYWDKYDLKIVNDSSIKNMEMLLPNLYHSNNLSKNSGYVGIIPLPENSQLTLQLTPQNIPDEPGFPVLLVNKETESNTLNSQYSSAKYQNGFLVNNTGTYHYPLDLSAFAKGDTNELQWTETNGYSHLIYRANNHLSIAISIESRGIWNLFSSYSYFFILFCTLALITFSLLYIFIPSTRRPATFKNRLQFSMLILLLFSTLMTGAGSIYYISKQYNKKNEENMTEKIKSVKLDIERRIKRRKAYSDVEYVKETLDRNAKVFFCDINYYDTLGQLVASSRNDIFDEGLLSSNMHPQAFYQMHQQNNTHYAQTEKIQAMNYLSAYTPFFNEEGKVVGYLNLPYFSRQNELSSEISNFLIALVNIYGLLVVFSLLAALVVSNYITKPLSIIQEKLKNISLGKRNEIIEWTTQDEIGSLVAEYNRKVLELSESAEKLAKSEREGAWREMAKQVAHEIKNPLTPMKLNVQYLKRLWKDVPSQEFEERLGKISSSLIEQIDTLSSIATEFSNFARMPDPVLEEVDMLNIVENCKQIYFDNKDVEIILVNAAKNTLVKADKDQMLRVFNNLIKNAIQAIPEQRQGKIELLLDNKNNKICIEVRDNGKGISDLDKEKIFIPNFTTKNSGMGLGLAMVKKMIEGVDGIIWFESIEGTGTSFFIELPLIH